MNHSLIQSYGAMDVKINALFITVKQYLPARFFTMPERHQKLIDVFRAGECYTDIATLGRLYRARSHPRMYQLGLTQLAR